MIPNQWTKLSILRLFLPRKMLIFTKKIYSNSSEGNLFYDFQSKLFKKKITKNFCRSKIFQFEEISETSVSYFRFHIRTLFFESNTLFFILQAVKVDGNLYLKACRYIEIVMPNTNRNESSMHSLQFCGDSIGFTLFEI